MVKDVRIEPVRGKQYRVVVKECKNAEQIHRTLDLKGGGFMCPLTITAIIALANERGFKEGANFFDYIKFSENLCSLTLDGAEAIISIER